ncbi:hypothetical protein ACN28S_56545 [Cystobacter fuscus]
MNNKWIVCLALALAGCGGAGPLGGTWKGTAGDWSVTVEFDQYATQGGASTFTGTATANKPSCFSTGTAAATLLNDTSATLVLSSMGSASDTTVQISGTLSGDQITGTLKAISTKDEACNTDSTPITLTRQ